MDPFQHPDLAQVGRSLRSKLDETLDAEQHAARASARRRMSIRDRLILAEDRTAVVVISTVDGHLARGVVDAVGVDHVVVEDHSTTRVISIQHIVSVEMR